ncbi:unnamed protein product [Dibothriocephalus latus]|uniref:Uncharacterized protein n=1 Tax=Dibothriocephalus latus TaxID=60516 RepID=A0A3P7R7T4_DIBLA|nr:unnamed protein product [Dibothriocephalus latus]
MCVTTRPVNFTETNQASNTNPLTAKKLARYAHLGSHFKQRSYRGWLYCAHQGFAKVDKQVRSHPAAGRVSSCHPNKVTILLWAP